MRKNLLTLLAFMAAPTVLPAQSFDDLAVLDVLPGWRTDAGAHIAAVRITLSPGWITYWRAPGDAGIPPQFTFTGSTAITSIQPHWPTPEVVDDKGMRSIGYYDSVVFPLTIDAAADAGDLSVSGELTIGVCEEICIPVNLEFDETLPAGGAPDPIILAALATQALTKAQANVGAVTCAIDPIGDGLRLTAQIAVPRAEASEFVVIETGDPSVWVSEADVAREGPTLSATVDMVHPSGGPFALDRSGVRITVFGGEKAIDIQGCSAG
ncbi:protein-disulfide reductase DsbD domain-containing protein [Loktanella sp. Alg231-35]|uniref:protein-disulfide reductase DsbD domain-containing protein n=1 Tax=Loktanella sp. Alg231-35 TaxID=1922220 RepID=UPI000D54E85D|nr:protein-disulfide reductase DsbD domain-containing protein [Loktanella sp. Alg231-35]